MIDYIWIVPLSLALVLIIFCYGTYIDNKKTSEEGSNSNV